MKRTTVLKSKLLAPWVVVLTITVLPPAEANETAAPSWMKWDAGKQETEIWLRAAYNACLTAGEKTRDLGGSLSCTGFTDAVIARL